MNMSHAMNTSKPNLAARFSAAFASAGSIPAKIKKAKALRQQGMSYGEISKAMGISRARACQLVKEA